MHSRRASWLAALAAVVICGGCGLAHKATQVPVEAARAIVPVKPAPAKPAPVEIEENLLRFADEFSWRMTVGADQLRRAAHAADPAEALRWKITIGTEINSIVSGPNSVANLLDMTVFVTVLRTSLEEYWQPKVFGDSMTPMLVSSRAAETNIWRLAGKLLTPAQSEELREAIAAWCRENPLAENVLAARAVGFTMQIAPTKTESSAKTDSVFNLLKLDPLASLDPATREIAETRLFAERALHVTHRMPMLLRWQAELLAFNAMEIPTVKQLVTNSTQITASIDRVARVTEQLPKQVSTEREEILKALQGQEKELVLLSAEIRQLLASGTQMSTSLNTTLVTFDGLMKRFGVGEPKTAPADTNTEPFRIKDYEQTAAQLAVTARELTGLLRTLDGTTGSTNLAKLTAQFTPVIEQAQEKTKGLVRYTFGLAVLFVLVASVLVVAARLVYGVLSRGSNASPTSSRGQS